MFKTCFQILNKISQHRQWSRQQHSLLKGSSECLLHYIRKVLKYKESHFYLRVVSAEFQTSRWVTHQQRTLYKLPALDSYPHSFPSSAKFFHIRNTRKQRNISNNKTFYHITYMTVMYMCFVLLISFFNMT